MGQHGAISNCLPRELPALRASDHLDTVGVRGSNPLSRTIFPLYPENVVLGQ